MSHKLFINLLYRGDKKQLSQEDDYVKEFYAQGLVATTVPILQFKFINLTELKDILSKKTTNQLNGLIITSPRVVEALWKALESLSENIKESILSKLEPNLVFIVGQKTAKDYIEKFSIDYNLDSSKTGDSNSLANYIYEYCNENFINEKINLLYPKSSLSDSKLESFLSERTDKIKVNSITVYETSVIKNIAEASIQAIKGIVDHSNNLSKLIINLIFFSPSGLNGFIEARDFSNKLKLSFPNIDMELLYSCIGSTTKAELLKNHIKVFCVSDRPNSKSLTESVTKSLQERESIMQ